MFGHNIILFALVTKVSAGPNESSKLSVYVSQENAKGLSAEANANATLEYLKQYEKLESLNSATTLSNEIREGFNKFLYTFRPKSTNDEESKYDEEINSATVGVYEKEMMKELGDGGNHKLTEEVLNKLQEINSGENTRRCVDPNVKYTQLTEELCNKKVADKQGHWLFGSDFKRDPTVGLEVTNPLWIDSQKKVLGYILKGMGKNLLEGKSIMNMSLPISIFSRDSILQRAAKSICYAPLYLEKASLTADPLEQFKLAVAFYFSMLHLGVEQQKPFNPIIGETYQALLGGTHVDLEQISHHPPISYLHVIFLPYNSILILNF